MHLSKVLILLVGVVAIMANSDKSNGYIEQYGTEPKNEQTEAMIAGVQAGIDKGYEPKLVSEGVSGTYFLKDGNGKNIGVFKPFDEDYFAPNNPKGHDGPLGMHRWGLGIVSGEGSVKEAATYYLDQLNTDKPFAGVPPTIMVKVVHPFFSKKKDVAIDPNHELNPIKNYSQYTNDEKNLTIKYGSIQLFMEGAEDGMPPGGIVPPKEIRKIAILDLRIMNADRHSGNYMHKKVNDTWEIIPVDHGFVFPDIFNISIHRLSEWRDELKNEYTPEEKAYIAKIDSKSDVEALAKTFKMREIVLRNFRITDMTLKKAVDAGISLYEIARFVYQQYTPLPLQLKNCVDEAEKMSQNSGFLAPGAEKVPMWRDEVFFKNFETVLDKALAAVVAKQPVNKVSQ